MSDTPSQVRSAEALEASKALIFGQVLNGQGGGSTIGWEEAIAWSPAESGGTLWLHVDRTVPALAEWLTAHLDIAPATVEVLVSNETRPRAFCESDQLVTILRGINFNPGAEPTDMIAMQIWSDGHRVVTLRRRHLQTPNDVRATLEQGVGPKTAGDLVTNLAERMVGKMNRSIVDMNSRIDAMEDDFDDQDHTEMLEAIGDIRRECLGLKRFMSPQHEALQAISTQAPSWFSKRNKHGIRESIDRLKRYLEDLDVSKESAIVLQDDIKNLAASQSNRTMYMLSVIAAIFLPLGFLTGLLGINVGGMPGVHDDDAFWVTLVALGGVFIVQLAIFRRLKWL